MSQRSLALAVAMGVAALAAAGCGSDDDGGDAATGESPTTASESSESPDGDTADTAEDGATTTAGDGEAGAAAGPVDACAALAGVDVEALLGEPASEPVADSDIMGDTCVVESAGDSRAGLNLTVTSQEPADNFENQRELLGVDSEAAGLGESAFHTGPYLVVLDGDALVSLQVVRDAATGPGVDDAALESAMTTVLATLSA